MITFAEYYDIFIEEFNNSDEIYMEFAKDPEKYEKQLREIVEASAKKSGYLIEAWHGSPEENITEFDPSKAGRRVDSGRFGADMTYFSDYEEADSYTSKYNKGNWSKSKPYHVYLKIENPLILKEGEGAFNALVERHGYVHNQVTFDRYQENGRKYGELISRYGYDGVFEPDAEYLGRSRPIWAVVNPNQIKSANLVTYDHIGIIPISRRFDDRMKNINR